MADETAEKRDKLEYDIAIREYWDKYAQKSIQDIHDSFDREKTFYKMALTVALAVGAALMTLGGWLGLSGLSKAEDAAKLQVAPLVTAVAGTEIREELKRQLSQENLTATITGIATNLAKPDVKATLAQILADQNYVRVGAQYRLQNFNSGRFLDVLGAGVGQGELAPVDASAKSDHTWIFTKALTH
jgi:hypothetical protein